MSFADEERAIQTRFATQWALSLYSDIPVYYTGVPGDPSQSETYLVLNINPGEGMQISMGNHPYDRYSGAIIVQIFFLPRSNMRIGKKIADTVKEIFLRSEFSAGDDGLIRCRVPYLSVHGVRHGWNQINVTIPYERDQYNQ